MLVINVISCICLFALAIYIICFLLRYRVIPQSLSITAEYSGRYTWWKITLCVIMGWLSYYYPTIYPYETYKLYPILSVAGVAGLSLAGYYSYSPSEEDKATLVIHKVGSFTGAICIVLFYLLTTDKTFQILGLLLGLLVLGAIIKGKRKGYPDGNSIVFWLEIGIMAIIGTDIIRHLIEAIAQ